VLGPRMGLGKKGGGSVKRTPFENVRSCRTGGNTEKWEKLVYQM
jgi:hypothetical protein